MSSHSVTVILSSYNQPNALRLALAGFAAQNYLDFELIVADDGSDEDIRGQVEAVAPTVPFPIAFVTQPHEGFGKERILNKAIVAAQGRQLLFADGDCVPFRNLVSTHRGSFREGTFATAATFRLTLEQSLSLTPEAVARGEHEHYLALRQRARLYWTHLHNGFYRLLDARREPKMRGGNFSADRQCLLDVDAFDESYAGTSAGDSDIRNRLRNLGCDGISLWHRAITCHLNHALDPRRLTSQAERRRRDPDLYYGSYHRVKALKGISSHRRGG